jgi:hypothetical protein
MILITPDPNPPKRLLDMWEVPGETDPPIIQEEEPNMLGGVIRRIEEINEAKGSGKKK